MIKIRRSEERGKADHGWLKSYFTFSFADYFDPMHMNFRSLRVINEDWVRPNKGFDTHPHNNMEILTYIVEGELAHKDSMGNGRTIKTGELQAMSAGTGIRHSEYNPSNTHPVHLLQIWITPSERSLTPSYAEWKPSADSSSNSLTLLASKDGRNGSVLIHQDAFLFLVTPSEGEKLNYKIEKDRHLWLQLIEGNLSMNNEVLLSGDGAAISEVGSVEVIARAKSKFLLFDLS